ncbi:hypothetical protein FRC03_001240 [Tulasnella sp. 419]|nr:hypothetical protein FRC03_001240 [Tulasnella sp. 419]
MSSRATFFTDPTHQHAHLSYVQRLRALKDIAVSSRRRSVRAGSLLTPTGRDSSSPTGRTLPKDEGSGAVSRLGYAFISARARFRREQERESQDGHREWVDSEVPSTGAKRNTLSRVSEPSYHRSQNPIASEGLGVKGTDKNQSGGDCPLTNVDIDIQVPDVERKMLHKELEKASSLLVEAKREIQSLQGALNLLKQSNTESQHAQELKLSGAERRINDLELSERAKDGEIGQLKRQSQKLVATCRRYREERNLERDSVGLHLLRIKELEMENLQLNAELQHAHTEGQMASQRQRKQAGRTEKGNCLSPSSGVDDILRGQSLMASSAAPPPRGKDLSGRKNSHPTPSCIELPRRPEEGQQDIAITDKVRYRIDFRPDRASTPHGPRQRRFVTSSIPSRSSNNTHFDARTKVSGSCNLEQEVVKPKANKFGNAGATSVGEHGIAHRNLGSAFTPKDPLQPEDRSSGEPVSRPETSSKPSDDEPNVILKGTRRIKETFRKACRAFDKPKPPCLDDVPPGANNPIPSQNDANHEPSKSNNDGQPRRTNPDGSRTQAETEPVLAEPLMPVDPAPRGMRKSSKLSTRRPNLHSQRHNVPQESASAATGCIAPDTESAVLYEPSSIVNSQVKDHDRQCQSEGTLKDAKMAHRKYKPPALKIAFSTTFNRHPSKPRQPTKRELLDREMYGWPQPSEKPDVFDAARQ